MKLATTWRDKTRDALAARPRSLTMAQVAEESGLPLHWLESFSRSVSADPGVCKIETLYNYLNSKVSNA